MTDDLRMVELIAEQAKARKWHPESVEAIAIRLADEVRRLREFAERVITPCDWGPFAFPADDEEINDAATRLGVFRKEPHAQPCADDHCNCEGSTELLYFAWK